MPRKAVFIAKQKKLQDGCIQGSANYSPPWPDLMSDVESIGQLQTFYQFRQSDIEFNFHLKLEYPSSFSSSSKSCIERKSAISATKASYCVEAIT